MGLIGSGSHPARDSEVVQLVLPPSLAPKGLEAGTGNRVGEPKRLNGRGCGTDGSLVPRERQGRAEKGSAQTARLKPDG